MLTDLRFHPGYDTAEYDIAEQFYIPALSEAVRYDRISGYFSSYSLLRFSKGIEGLYKNNGKFRLIISNEISPHDFDLIRNGYSCRELVDKFKMEFREGYESFSIAEKRDWANLSFLIEIGLVDIKVGFVNNSIGLFHAKTGLITDAFDNTVHFNGSFNETANAFNNNYESISIHKSWESPEVKKYIENEKEKFELLWMGTNTDNLVFVRDFEEVLKNELITYSEGRLVMEPDLMIENALVLYFNDQKLKVRNNLKNHVIDESNRQIQKLERNFMSSPRLWDFKANLSYSEVQHIIDQLQRYASRKEIRLVVSDSVLNYIEAMKFQISEIAKRGAAMKAEDAIFLHDLENFEKIVNREITRPLRGIQNWVSFYMAKMKRVANFSVPGSGKTSMVYGAYAYLSSPEINDIDKIVVISPKNAFLAWKEEFNKVFGVKRNLVELDIHDSNFTKEKLWMNVSKYNVMLFNYEALPSYQDDLKRLIDGRTMVVFDEVHKVKGIQSMRAPIAIEVAQHAKYRYVLTGTPIPNSYQDINNFLHILYKNEYKDFFGFSSYFLQAPSVIEAEEINKKLYPFFWRVTKQQLGVPPVNPDRFIRETASAEEQALISLLWKKYRKEPFKLYIRLIQMSSNPSMIKCNIERSMFIDVADNDLDFEFSSLMEDIPNYSSDELALINRVQQSTKFEAAINKVKELSDEGKTSIVWCIFVDTILKLKKRLENIGLRVVVIYGAIADEERTKIIKAYQNGEYDVLVTNPHTLAESVSLHTICHDAIYLEYSFNLTHMLQSRDRIHRLGLEDGQYTNYFYCMLDGIPGEVTTIDAKIYDRLKEKEGVMINAIEGGILAPNFTFDEKEEILKIMQEE